MARTEGGWSAGRVALHSLLAFSALAFVFLAIGPRTGLYKTMTVLTGSMDPSFPKGSLVVSTPQPVDQVSAGQVITFYPPEGERRVVTHRVVNVMADPAGTGQPVVETRGDANATPDPWQARLEGDTAWRARFAIPYVGYALRFLHTAGRGAWLLFPALFALVCLFEIWAPGPRRRSHVAVAR